MSVPVRARLPLIASAMGALAAGLWIGLARLPWDVSIPDRRWLALHGPLMTGGFLGTLIGLERAAGLGRTWAYGGPLLSAAGAVALLVFPEDPAGPFLILASSCWLAAVFAAILKLQKTLFNGVMLTGAIAWLAGNALWVSGRPVQEAALFWAGFLVLTIAGERLELTRLLPPSPAGRALFVLASGLLAAGLALGPWHPEAGGRTVAAGLSTLAAWLWRFDIARRTVNQPGLPRFAAISLLSGYAWLGGAGILLWRAVPLQGGLASDAALHALFLGFVFSMIFAHAPIVLGGVLGVPVAFRSAFYAPLALLHLSLAIRIWGDGLGIYDARRWGGVLGAAAIVFFLAAVLLAVRSALAARQERPK